MDIFQPIPIDVLQINEESVVDLFIKKDDRLTRLLGKGDVFTRQHAMDLGNSGVSRIFVRGKDSSALTEYVSSNSGRILRNPTVPSKVKAATFYVSSINAFRKAFDDPDEERIGEIKKILKPMFRNIMNNEILLSDLFTITEYDFTTYTHSVNVGILATSLAITYYKDESPFTMEEMERFSYGYFLHDIGKSRIPLNILKKKGKLGEYEWMIMRRHPEWGHSILMETGHLTEEAAVISLQHHERPDGSGYPSGITDIHPCARICAIADIYEALTSVRPYKSAMKPFDALKFINEEALTEFDLDLLRTLIRLLGPQADHIQLSHPNN